MYRAEIQSKRSGGWLALHEVQRRLQILDLHNQELLFVAELFICTNMIFSNRARVKCETDVPSLSLWKVFKKFSNFSLFRRRMDSIWGGFFGFATKTWITLYINKQRWTQVKPTETNLEHVECFELNIFALISQQIHHHLQVSLVGNVSGHHAEVGAVQKDLAEQLQ